MKKISDNKPLKTWLSYFLLAVAVIAAYKLITQIEWVFYSVKRFLGIIAPFISGFIIAYILNIPRKRIARWMERSKVKFFQKHYDGISVVTIYLLFGLIVYMVLRLILPAVYRSIYDFIVNFPVYYANIQNLIDHINQLEIIPVELGMNQLLEMVKSFGIENLSSSIGAVFGVSSAIFNGALAIISSLYFILERRKLKAFVQRLMRAFIKEKQYQVLVKYTSALDRYFKQYIYCQTLDGCILGTIATIELFLLKSPYALILGIMLGVVNYIPYFGSIIGVIVTAVIIAFTQGFSTALLALIILAITQQLDGNLIQPRLMGSSFSLSPLLIIISITIGGAIGGILGMVAAIPIVAVLKNILDDFMSYREQEKAAVQEQSNGDS